MERHINALERNDSKAALQLDWFRLGVCLLATLLDDVDKMLLDILQRHLLHKLMDVNLLHLKHVEHIGHAVKRSQIASTDVLHVSDVVVDNLDQPASRLGNVLDNVLQRLLVEGPADAAGIDSTHRIVGSAFLVTFDRDLHCQATVEDDRHQAFNRHHFGDRSECRVLAQRVAGKAAVSLN